MTELERLRVQVHRIDNVILELLRQRFVFTDAIGEEKRRIDIPIDDIAWEYIKMQMLMDNATAPLDREDVMEIFSTIINRSRRRQEQQ